MKKIFSIGALAVALIMGMSSCQKEKINSDIVDGSTHVSVALTMAKPNVRALPEDYNHVGKWFGKDQIKRIDIYVVDVAKSTIATGQFELGDFDVTTAAPDGSTQITLTPKKAIKTTPGAKKVYAVINATPEVAARLSQADPAEFDKKMKTEAMVLVNSGMDKSKSETSASKLAKVEGPSMDDWKDIIVMTNDADSDLTVEDNVKEQEAIAGTKNRAKVNVSRVVARAIVTASAGTYEVKSTAGTLLGTISNINWVLAQGEDRLFLQRKADFVTPSYSVKLSADEFITTGNLGYDYSGLYENYQPAPNFGGTNVPVFDPYKKDNVTDLGLDKRSYAGKFVLPTIHVVGDTKETSGYTKGNTVYVLIRANFTPKEMADGTAYTPGSDFYVGETNGKFYSSNANAKDPDKGGVAGQKSRRYVGGKVLYYAWLNPDKIPGWMNSPVVRNNIYHIQIKSFKTIGTNWNPLFPEDPNTPDPKNPDPKPENPDEPGDNPIKPEDPLTTPETWMSVDVTVLPWEVHTYEVDLSI